MGPRGGGATHVVRAHALLREVNERISEVARGFGLDEPFAILCECASPDCGERIELRWREYDRLRRAPTHFAVVPRHVVPGPERVVRENDRFATVEALGDGGATARDLDPRRRR